MGRPVAVILLVVGVLSGMVSPTQSGATSDPWVCGAYDQTAEAGRKATPDGNGTTHPIVFIHGITDSDAAWTAKLDRSDNPYTKLDPPRSFVDQMVGMDGATGTVPQGIKHAQVYTFSYTKNSLRWVDDEHVGGEFAKTIDCLYEKHGTPVAVVAHSMGGLVTRWVANTDDGEGQPRSEKLGKIITIGTPYDGSALATVANAGIGGIQSRVAHQLAAVADDQSMRRSGHGHGGRGLRSAARTRVTEERSGEEAGLEVLCDSSARSLAVDERRLSGCGFHASAHRALRGAPDRRAVGRSWRCCGDDRLGNGRSWPDPCSNV